MNRFLGLCILGLGIGLNTLWAQSTHSFIPYRTKAGYGYCDSNKHLLIAPRFVNAGQFWQGRAPVSVQQANGKVGFALIDTSGNYLVPPERGWNGSYFSFSGNEGGRASWDFNVQDSLGRWGVMDAKGYMRIPALYNGIRHPYANSDGHPSFQRTWRQSPDVLYAVVKRNGKIGVLDSAGQEMIPIQYDLVEQAAYWYPTLFHVRTAGKENLRFLGQPEMLPLIYDRVQPFAGVYTKDTVKIILVSLQGRKGIVNAQNKVLVPILFDSVIIVPHNDGTVHYNTLLNTKWGWYSGDGSVQVPPVAKSLLEQRGAYYVTMKRIGPIGNSDSIRAILYNAKGQRVGIVLLRSQHDLEIKNDSVFIRSYTETRDSTESYLAWYNLKTKELGPAKLQWKLERLYDLGMPHRGSETYLEPLRPYLDSAGQKLYKIRKENKDWEIKTRLGDFYAVTRQSYDTSDVSYGVVDKNQNWVIRPQSKYEVISWHFTENWLVAKFGTQYIVTDTLLRPRTAPLPYRPATYYSWQQKSYVLVSLKDSSCKSRDNPYGGRNNCPHEGWSTLLLDSAGNVVWNPGPKTVLSYQENFSVKPGWKQVLLASDSATKCALFTPLGEALLPPTVQYRYFGIEAVGLFGLLAFNTSWDRTSSETGNSFLKFNGQEWFPGKRIVFPRDDYSQLGQPFRNFPTDPLPRYLLRITTADQPLKPFFINANGTIYADAEALAE